MSDPIRRAKLESNERTLLEKARKGDHSAFKELVKKYEHQVAATVIGMLGQTPEADDIGQETFIRFYKSMARFRGESSVGTYLVRIAINLSLNELRRRKRQNLVSLTNHPSQWDFLPDRKPERDKEEDRKLIQKALKELEPKFRTVVILRLLEGYTTRETAKILRLPTGTVLSRLTRAQQKLRALLTPLYG